MNPKHIRNRIGRIVTGTAVCGSAALFGSMAGCDGTAGSLPEAQKLLEVVGTGSVYEVPVSTFSADDLKSVRGGSTKESANLENSMKRATRKTFR